MKKSAPVTDLGESSRGRQDIARAAVAIPSPPISAPPTQDFLRSLRKYFPSFSLKTRILLWVSLFIIAGVWGLALHVASVLQAELQKTITEHLSTTVGYVATDLDHEIRLRTDTLRDVAASITPEMLANPAALKSHLERRSVARSLFPLGIWVANREGIGIAEHPQLEGRLGGSIADRDHFRAAMAVAPLAIGTPVEGRFWTGAMAPIAVPLRDATGAAAGALVGPLILSDWELFGRLEETRLGASGFFLVISPTARLIVSASDKDRILKPLPARGVNPVLDRRVESGVEDAAIVVDSRGIEVLSVSRNLKSTGWIVVAGIPTAEAFAPIRTLTRQVYMAALVLTLVIGLVLRFVLSRQLAPLAEASNAMREMTAGETPFAQLPVRRDDEIGELVGDFNCLVAERARLDSELHASEERYRRLFADSRVVSLVIDPVDGRIVDANAAASAFYGHAPDVLKTMNIAEINTLSPEQVSAEMGRARARQRNHFDFRHRLASGAIRDVEVTSGPIAVGARTLLLSTIIDVTERKRAEKEREQYLEFFNASSDLMGFADPNGCFKKVNPAFSQVLGYSDAELVARPFIEFVHPDDRQRTIEEMERQLQRGYSVDFENRYACKDGSYRWLSWRAIFDKAEGITYATARDVTERKAAEEQIRDFSTRLEERVRERTARLQQALVDMESFSYSVSHDLRAPLRAINGYSEILLAEEMERLSDEGRRMLGRIAQGATHLGDLIDDILEYARAGRLLAHPVAVDLESMARGVADAMRKRYPEIAIEVKRLPVVFGDKVMLEQILRNLIGNACKFSAKCERPIVEVGAREQGGETVFYVKDNGIGFDMAYARKLFGMFQRMHQEGEFPGTGVGLAIVKRLLRHHDGRIWAEATPNGGATFYFVLARAA